MYIACSCYHSLWLLICLIALCWSLCLWCVVMATADLLINQAFVYTCMYMVMLFVHAWSAQILHTPSECSCHQRLLKSLLVSLFSPNTLLCGHTLLTLLPHHPGRYEDYVTSCFVSEASQFTSLSYQVLPSHTLIVCPCVHLCNICPATCLTQCMHVLNLNAHAHVHVTHVINYFTCQTST